MNLTLPIVLLVVAAIGGLTLAVLHFRNRPLPPLLAAAHGLAAATALAFLAYPFINGMPTLEGVGTALVILLAAALGGFILLTFFLKGRRLPSALVLIHGAVAAAGLGCLMWVAFG